MLDDALILRAAKAAMPNASAAALAAVEAVLPELRSDLTTPDRVAGFFAQLGHESADLARLEENLNYSAERLPQVWPSRFKGNHAAIARCARNPQELANTVYADRMGNGPYESGDGWKNRGRGPLQITGADNYRLAGEAIGIDLVDDPDLVLELPIGLRVAAWFCRTNRVFSAMDAGDHKLASRRINGGYHGLDDRLARTRRGLAAIESSHVPSMANIEPELAADDVPQTLRKGARGGQVAEAQALLGVATDGIFGEGTKQAVIAFQIEHDLAPDGVVGPATWRALEAA